MKLNPQVLGVLQEKLRDRLNDSSLILISSEEHELFAQFQNYDEAKKFVAAHPGEIELDLAEEESIYMVVIPKGYYQEDLQAIQDASVVSLRVESGSHSAPQDEPLFGIPARPLPSPTFIPGTRDENSSPPTLHRTTTVMPRARAASQADVQSASHTPDASGVNEIPVDHVTMKPAAEASEVTEGAEVTQVTEENTSQPAKQPTFCEKLCSCFCFFRAKPKVDADEATPLISDQASARGLQ